MARTLVVAGLCAAFLAGCQSEAQQADAAAIEQEILGREDQWNRAYAERNAEALANFFTDDAAMAMPGQQLVRGKEAISEATAEVAKDPNLKLTFRANRVQVASSGDLAYSRGQYMLTMTNPATRQPQSSQGYYLTVWKKQEDGSWKAVEDFVTPGQALPVAERATMIE